MWRFFIFLVGQINEIILMNLIFIPAFSVLIDCIIPFKETMQHYKYRAIDFSYCHAHSYIKSLR
jgi:hypothetical protein